MGKLSEKQGKMLSMGVFYAAVIFWVLCFFIEWFWDTIIDFSIILAFIINLIQYIIYNSISGCKYFSLKIR